MLISSKHIKINKLIPFWKRLKRINISHNKALVNIWEVKFSTKWVDESEKKLWPNCDQDQFVTKNKS